MDTNRYSLAADILKHEEAALEEIFKKLGEEFLKFIGEKEYERIKDENKRQRDYGAFISLMDDVAKKRLVTCKTGELSRDCPMATVYSQYYQEGRTTDGTAPMRMFSIIGSDGQIINVQGFDLTQTINVTVVHKDGTSDLERIDPSEAIKRIRREAGYAH